MTRNLLLLAVLLAAGACSNGSTATPGKPAPKQIHPSCSGVAGKHHAYVVLVHGSGSAKTACAGFDTASVSGFSLMKNAGVAYASQSTQYGPEVCQVDGEPSQYSQCLPANSPYWESWVWSGGAWAPAQKSFADIQFADHQALGWVYTSPTASPAPPPSPPAR